MSMSDAIGRIQQIQSTLTQLTHPAAATTGASRSAATQSTDAAAPPSALAGTDTTGTADNSAVFGQALSSALAGTAPAGPAAPGAGSVTGNQVVADAEKYVGVPYVWGGTDPATGMDCSGFVQRVYKDMGITLPRLVRDQMKYGTPVASLADAKPGDLLISFGGDHVAIYVGNGKAIDAPVPGKTIQVRDAWEKYSNLYAIRRIVPDNQVSAQSTGITPIGNTSAPLNATQRQYAQAIINQVHARGLPNQAAVDAISTALQESSLRMYWNPKVAGSQGLAPDSSAMGTDGYSVGLFQQQVNGNNFSWGTVNDAMDPAKSTDMFLNRLTSIAGWQNLPVTVADQTVQGSAYPDAYAKWEAEARQIVSDLSPTGA